MRWPWKERPAGTNGVKPWPTNQGKPWFANFTMCTDNGSSVGLDSSRLVLDVAISFNRVHALVEVATVFHSSCNFWTCKVVTRVPRRELLGAALNRTGLWQSSTWKMQCKYMMTCCSEQIRENNPKSWQSYSSTGCTTDADQGKGQTTEHTSNIMMGTRWTGPYFKRNYFYQQRQT